MTTMTNDLVQYLITRYDLEDEGCVRYQDEGNNAIECYGRMPNSNSVGWFAAGFESEIRAEMDESK